MTARFLNLLPRVAVAAIAIPLIVYVTYIGGVWFFLFVSTISILALDEFYRLAAGKGSHPQRIMGMVAAVFINLAFFQEQLQLLILPVFVDRGIGIPFMSKLQLFSTVLFLFVLLVLSFELFRNKGSAFLNTAFTLLGVAYVAMFCGTLIGLRELYGMEFPIGLVRRYATTGSALTNDEIVSITYSWGGLTLISILASLWMCDTAAYFGGVAIGRHKMFPRVSPGKTWEGTIFGFAAALLTMMLAQYFFLPYLEKKHAFMIGLIIGVFGQLGDLVESLFKRDAGVKDSSALIPGHGGVFDRFDSLIFVSPILYLYIDFVVLS